MLNVESDTAVQAPIFTIDMLRSTGDHGEAGGAENTAAADEHEESKGDGGKQRKKAPRPRPLQRQPTLEEAMFLNSLRTGALSMMKSIALVQRKESMSHVRAPNFTAFERERE